MLHNAHKYNRSAFDQSPIPQEQTSDFNGSDTRPHISNFAARSVKNSADNGENITWSEAFLYSR